MKLIKCLGNLALAATLSLGMAAASAQELVKIRFQLDWRFDGSATPFLLGAAKGYFKQEGLDVTIDAGAGSAAAVARLAGGNYEMGYGDTSSLIEYLANNSGARIQAVYMVLDSTPAAAMFMKKSNITKPSDLMGKTFGAPVFDAGRKLWPLFARSNGLDPAGVKWQSMDPQLREPMMVRGQIDVATGFQPSSMLSAIAAGAKEEDIGILYYKDYGVKVYGNAILASSKFIEQNPKAVAGFLRAFNRALKESIANPEEAIKYVKEKEPIVDTPIELRRWKAYMGAFIVTPNTKAGGIGAVSKLRLDTQVEDVAKAFNLKTPPSSDLIFNSQFLPARSDRQI
jgi:NitT/TauT family transport system substrate-binding protein